MYKILSVQTKLEAIIILGAVRTFDGKLPPIEDFCRDKNISRRTLYNLYSTAVRTLEEFLITRTPGPSTQKEEVVKIDPRVIIIRNELSAPGKIVALQKERVVLLAQDLKRKEKLPFGKFCELTGLEERTFRMWRRTYNGTTKSLEDKRFKKNKIYRDKVKKTNGFKKLFSGAQVLMDTTFIKFFGFKFSIIAAMDAFNKRVLSIKVFSKENSDAVIKTMKIVLKKTGAISFVLDNGRPYVAKKVKRFLENSCVLRILCAPYHPQSKGAIERWFRTMKLWLKQPFKLLAKSTLSILCNMVVYKHNKNLPLPQKPVISIEKSFKELEKRTKNSLRKRDIIYDIQSSCFLNNNKPASVTIKQFPIEVLIEGFKRLNEIRGKEGFSSSKNTGSYFIGILKNILPEHNKRLLHERKRKQNALLALRLEEEQNQREQQQRLFYAEHPEYSLIEYVESFINLKKANLSSTIIINLMIKSWKMLLNKYDVAFKSIPCLLDKPIEDKTSLSQPDKTKCKHIIKNFISFTSVKEKSLRQFIKNAKVEMVFDDIAFRHEIINQNRLSDKGAF